MLSTRRLRLGSNPSRLLFGGVRDHRPIVKEAPTALCSSLVDPLRCNPTIFRQCRKSPDALPAVLYGMPECPPRYLHDRAYRWRVLAHPLVIGLIVWMVSTLLRRRAGL
jgi:hypothetical protein